MGMVLVIIATPVAIASLIFALYHLSSRVTVLRAEDPTGPAQVTPGRNLAVVGIAQPWEPPGISAVTQQPVVWARALRKTSGVFGDNGGNYTRQGPKIATAFMLRDEAAPDAAIAIESGRIGLPQVMIRTRRFGHDGTFIAAEGDGALDAISAVFGNLGSNDHIEEKAIYPGERLYVYGKVHQRDGYLAMGRGATIDDRPPEVRIARQTSLARGALAVCGVAVVVAVLGVVLQVV